MLYLPSSNSTKEKKRRIKIKIENDLAILPSYDNQSPHVIGALHR